MTAILNEPPQGGGKQQLHNARFYTIKPRAIVGMAYNKLSKCLALSRETDCIELWNMEYAPYLDRVIHLLPGSPVEALAWAGTKRLFSADLTGKLIEWDVLRLRQRYEQSPTGNALWSMDINGQETELAVGSEEGHINIMSIENDEITYKSIFNKQKGRVLCCKFDKSGKHLITGSEGYVRIWSVLKGHTLHTMTLSAKDVIVWCLRVLADNTIVAGDSAGFVTVWNAENATQIDRQRVLDKNVFALALNEEEDRLVCSGMEPPLIRVFSKTKIRREESESERWIKFVQRDAHKHYVKSLAMIDPLIVSGGLDGILTITSSERSSLPQLSQHAPFLQGSAASVAIDAKLLLLRYPHSLDLWRLGTVAARQEEEDEDEERWDLPVGHTEDLVLAKPPQKLLQLNVREKSFIQAAALSPDAAWICYSTLTDVRLSRLTQAPLQVERRPAEDLPQELTPASHILFTKQQQLLLLDPKANRVNFFDLEEDRVLFRSSLDLGAHLKRSVSHLVVSPDGEYLVAASTDHLIGVWRLQPAGKHKHLVNLPRHRAGTTALAMHEGRPRLVVAYADGRLVEYDLVKRAFTCETVEYLIPGTKHFCIRGIILDPKNPNIFLVHTEEYLYVLERNKRLATEDYVVNTKSKKYSQESRSLMAANPNGMRLKTQLPRQHLVHVFRLSPNELVNVSISTSNLLASLPPPFQRKRFGAS
ncbi:U3 small nucleolar RNA-associated protein 4 homolog [Drosophila persimilis]|uniref:U3 small nucleolar RNA-associated protein 4 homolog n=1 Tax=Drosophila persimilis TaxID=7234 RepID=UPI000F07AA44|nr:U3 small nucleolar RNA-associated protein 4 homolog [Drosophila persimilis]